MSGKSLRMAIKEAFAAEPILIVSLAIPLSCLFIAFVGFMVQFVPLLFLGLAGFMGECCAIGFTLIFGLPFCRGAHGLRNYLLMLIAVNLILWSILVRLALW